MEELCLNCYICIESKFKSKWLRCQELTGIICWKSWYNMKTVINLNLKIIRITCKDQSTQIQLKYATHILNWAQPTVTLLLFIHYNQRKRAYCECFLFERCGSCFSPDFNFLTWNPKIPTKLYYSVAYASNWR